MIALSCLAATTVAVGADVGTDFDGDGRDDVFWYAPGAGADYVWHGARSGFSSRPMTVNGDYRPVAGDFDGDGRDDVLWYAPGSGSDYVWYGGRSGFSSRAVSVNGDYRPVVGDFDGDGRDDVLWYAPGSAPDYVWTGRKSGFGSYPVSVNGDYRPVAGDFDGNGFDDIVWYAPGSGSDYVWYGGRSGFSSRPLSINGDYRPVGDVWSAPPPRTPPVSTRSAANPMRSLAPGQVALTFDDGPGLYTPRVLEILDRAGVPATFFVVGDRVASGAPLLRRAHAAGHSIQGHSWSHGDLTRLSATGVAADVTRTANAIQAVTGERPTCFRPPYGAYNSRVLTAASAAGARPAVLWNVETSDYRRPAPSTIAHRALAQADGRGLIVLMHDGGGTRANTIAALPTIIDQLQRRGYEFVTLCN